MPLSSQQVMASQAQGSTIVAFSLTGDHTFCRMNDSPMSLPPTPETKLRDGYKVTTGQPAFATCERSKHYSNSARRAIHRVSFSHRLVFEHGCSRAAPQCSLLDSSAATEGPPPP